MDTIAYGPGPDQVLDLHLPAGSGRVPVVVLVHGGFWREVHVRDLTDPLARDVADRGWAAVNLEYGRVGGTGGWPRTFEDVAAGIDSLTAHGTRLDLDRVAVVGHSAGGLLATWTAARPALPPGAPGADPAVVPRAVASLAGVNLLGRAADSGLGDGNPSRALLDGLPDEVPDRYAVADPSRSLPLAAPWLGLHARDDESIPLGMTTDFAELQRDAGGEATVELVAGDHMSVIDPGRDSWDVVVRWLERHLA